MFCSQNGVGSIPLKTSAPCSLFKEASFYFFVKCASTLMSFIDPTKTLKQKKIKPIYSRTLLTSPGAKMEGEELSPLLWLPVRDYKHHTNRGMHADAGV